MDWRVLIENEISFDDFFYTKRDRKKNKNKNMNKLRILRTLHNYNNFVFKYTTIVHSKKNNR